MRMSGNEMTDRIKAFWNETSDSEWYRSLRANEKIRSLKEKPESAFHPAVYELIRKFLPDMKGRRILLPSSGDNHAAFAFAMMGACVTSADISERQLENASAVAGKLDLNIEFICDDTMKLSCIHDSAYDMVYTSNGTLSWISDIDSMYRNIYRVLKKGGMLSIVELTTPVSFPMKQLFWLYSHTFLPIYGKLISKDERAYSYLTKTIEAFPQGEQMMQILKKAGFAETRFKRLTFGICTLYIATK